MHVRRGPSVFNTILNHTILGIVLNGAPCNFFVIIHCAMKGKFSAKGLDLLTSWAPIEYGNTSFCSLIMVSLLLPPLLDGPAHKCADWGTTCNMVGSFKDVPAITGWKILSFLLRFRRKIRFYEHKLIRFWANNIIIKTLRGFHLYLCNLCIAIW